MDQFSENNMTTLFTFILFGKYSYFILRKSFFKKYFYYLAFGVIAMQSKSYLGK